MKQVGLNTARETMQAAKRIRHRDPQAIARPECAIAAEVEKISRTHHSGTGAHTA